MGSRAIGKLLRIGTLLAVILAVGGSFSPLPGKDARTAALRSTFGTGAEKIDLPLLEAYRQPDPATRSGAIRDAIAKGVSMNDGILRTAKGTLVEVLVDEVTASTEDEFNALPGVRVIHVSEAWNRVTLEVTSEQAMLAAAQKPATHRVIPVHGRQSHAGSVMSQAPIAMNIVEGMNRWGVDGSGQKVGIISDSFAQTPGVRVEGTTPGPGESGILRNARNQISGDLPPEVEIIRDLPLGPEGQITGSDEGAAMAELVHDIVPGAGIAFYTGFISQSAFADGITALADAGSTVVVDDIIWFAEPMYQHGIIAQSAQNVVRRGVPYFSSAGNNGNVGIKTEFRDINPAIDNDSFPPDGNDFHMWDNGTPFLPVTVHPGSDFIAVLQWNQPFDSVSSGRGAEVDLDLYILLEPTFEDILENSFFSLGVQGTPGNPFGDPVEMAGIFNPTPVPVTVYLAVNHHAGPQDFIPQNPNIPLEFRMAFFGALFQIEGITDDRAPAGAPTIYGHAAAPLAVAVGAVPWYDTPNYDINFAPTNAIDPEPFSSRGGELTFYFNEQGFFDVHSAWKPEIAGVDGTNTTFFGFNLDLSGFAGQPDGHPNFFGTSASAPNVAAVGALMRQLVPGLSPAEMLDIMTQTAIDVTGRRAAPGRDDVTGHGLVDATAALDELGARYGLTPPPQPTPTPRPVQQATFAFAESAQGWELFGVPGFDPPTGSATGGHLVLGIQNSNNAFGFYRSPVFRVGTWQELGEVALNGTSGPGSLYRATYRVTSDVAVETQVPDLRFRASSADFSRTSELTVSSTTANGFAPAAGATKTYHQYFALPAGAERFRLFTDVINVGSANASTAQFFIDEMRLEALGVEVLGFGRQERTYDFRNTTLGWTMRGAPGFAMPSWRGETNGLRVGPALSADPAFATFFGFWGSPEADPEQVRIDDSRIYRARYRVSSNATDSQRNQVPAFRMRVNDESLNMAALLHIASSGDNALVPFSSTKREYDLFFEGRGELLNNALRFAFDYIKVPGDGNSPAVTLTLEHLQVDSFPKPAF